MTLQFFEKLSFQTKRILTKLGEVQCTVNKGVHSCPIHAQSDMEFGHIRSSHNTHNVIYM